LARPHTVLRLVKPAACGSAHLELIRKLCLPRASLCGTR
jgi:hypothetical protein